MSRKASAEAGFTLLEMLVVLAIMAFIAAIAMPLARGLSPQRRLEVSAENMVSSLRITRAYAIGHNQAQDFAIDVNLRAYNSPAFGLIALPGDIAIEMRIAKPLQDGATLGALRFYPDGQSSGGDIVLRAKDGSARISVNWLTGEAKIEP